MQSTLGMKQGLHSKFASLSETEDAVQLVVTGCLRVGHLGGSVG